MAELEGRGVQAVGSGRPGKAGMPCRPAHSCLRCLCMQGLLGTSMADPEGFSVGMDSRKSEDGGEVCRLWEGREWIHGSSFLCLSTALLYLLWLLGNRAGDST